MMTEKSKLRKASDADAQIDATLREAKALGDPTRYQIFRYIDEAKRPVYVDELTELLHVNHNAVRQHLAVLKDAQLVVDQLETRSKPGRPRLLYSINPKVPGTWNTEGPYQTVAILMAEILKSRRSARDVGREAGKRRLQRSKGPKPSALKALRDSLEIEGFSPRQSRSDKGWEFVLERCPYVEVASVDPGTVCQLHLGLLEGMMQELDPRIKLHLTVHEPRRAGCGIRVSGAEEGPRED